MKNETGPTGRRKARNEPLILTENNFRAMLEYMERLVEQELTAPDAYMCEQVGKLRRDFREQLIFQVEFLRKAARKMLQAQAAEVQF